MSKLEQAYVEFAECSPCRPGYPERFAFMCGAAAMAEILFTGQAPVLDVIRDLCKQMTTDAVALRAQIKETGHQITGDLTKAVKGKD